MTDYEILSEEKLFSSSYLSPCVGIYNNNSGSNNKYMMAEFNTGLRTGSVNAITKSYPTIEELKNNFDKTSTNYRILDNYVITRYPII